MLLLALGAVHTVHRSYWLLWKRSISDWLCQHLIKVHNFYWATSQSGLCRLRWLQEENTDAWLQFISRFCMLPDLFWLLTVTLTSYHTYNMIMDPWEPLIYGPLRITLHTCVGCRLRGPEQSPGHKVSFESKKCRHPQSQQSCLHPQID